MNRSCGECTLCCKLLPVREIEKHANTRCIHQRHSGCRVYRKDGFPLSCRLWSCLWLVDAQTAGLRRPDRSGYVIDMVAQPIWAQDNETGEMQETAAYTIWCDPARREAWRDPALLALVDQKRVPLLVRYSVEEAMVVIPPSLANGEWLEMPSELHPTAVVIIRSTP
jgi:hypothetical protein